MCWRASSSASRVRASTGTIGDQHGGASCRGICGAVRGFAGSPADASATADRRTSPCARRVELADRPDPRWSDRVDTIVKAVFRSRPQLDTRLLVVFPVPSKNPVRNASHDHRRRLVEASAQFIHRAAERCEFAPREAAAKSHRSRPLHSRSSTAACSATRTGSCQGRITAAVPRSMPGQAAAREV